MIWAGGWGGNYLYEENGGCKEMTWHKYDEKLTEFLDKEYIDMQCTLVFNFSVGSRIFKIKSLGISRLMVRNKCMEACSVQSIDPVEPMFESCQC